MDINSKAFLVSEVEKMPGIHATFRYAFDGSNPYQNVYCKSTLAWMVRNGMVETVIGEFNTIPSFLCGVRRYTQVKISDKCRQVIKDIQAKS